LATPSTLPVDIRREETAMTRLVHPALGRLRKPLPVESFPFVGAMEVADATLDPDEPSPCLPTAASCWLALRPDRAGILLVDLAGSTPLDPLVRLYSHLDNGVGGLVFLGCASPVWNGNLVLEAEVRAGESYAVQVGTSASRTGRVVLRAELREARPAA
jgi:hypothetical protein